MTLFSFSEMRVTKIEMWKAIFEQGGILAISGRCSDKEIGSRANLNQTSE